MKHSSSSKTIVTAAPIDNDVSFPPVEKIDASCRAPLMFLFTAALLWLVVGSLFGVLSSIKMHAPGMLANVDWLTYGRVRPAAVDMFLYGFLSQAGIAAAIWILCRLGKVTLVGGPTLLVGAMFWNLGVLLGVTGIFSGDSTGYQWFEFPRYATAILFVSYLMMGIAALLTFAFRNQRHTYASQWFILAALFVFPWLLSTAGLLLLVSPVRGVAQMAIAYWFANGFLMLWLMPLALGIIFYMVPKLSEQPLNNHYLAVVSFWMWLLFAGWSGVPVGARLPAWMPSVSTVASVLLLVPAFAMFMNWRATWIASRAKQDGGATFKFTSFAVFAFLLTALLMAGAALPPVARTVEFTLFGLAGAQLATYGVVAMTIFSAIYFIVPRISGTEWIDSRIKMHFLLSAGGLILIAFAWGVGGILQGSAWNGANPFMKSVAAAVPFIGVGTLGFLLLLVAHLLFLSNLMSVIRTCCAACCGCGKEARK